MARVTVLEVNGRPVETDAQGRPRRKVEGFFANLPNATLEATVDQLRVLSQESRELILDKLYAGRARPPGRRRVARPEREAQREDIPGASRRPFRHQALADSTVERKDRDEKDGRPLIASGDYTYGIEVFKGQQKGVTYYMVRPKPGIHREARVSHRVLAAILERGTSSVPPRPHWGPTFRVIEQELRRLGPEVLAEALRRAVRERR